MVREVSVEYGTVKALHARPIWNWIEGHIKAHLFVCFIAYLHFSLSEMEARKRIAGITGVKMLDKLKILTRRAKRGIDTSEVEELLSTMVDES